MKKILLLFLFTVASYGQAVFDEGIQIKNNTTDNSATKVNVQSTDGTINTISKSDLVNVVEVNDVPSLPLVGNAGKIYVVKNLNKIYRWNSTFYQELAVTDISGLQAQLDLKANDSEVVKLTGNQTISGQKSFSLTGKIDMQTNNAFPAIRVTALGSNGITAAEFINNSSSPYSSALILQTSPSGGVGNRTLDVINMSPIGTGIFSNASNGGVSISSESDNGDSYISNITEGGTGRNYVGRNNGTETYSVDKTGNVLGNSYIKRSTPANNILLAGGGDLAQGTAFNKNFGLNTGDVVGATTLLNQYGTTPIDWTATAFNSGQVVFYGGRQWIAKMATVAGDVPAVSSKWDEITFESLANKTVTVDQTIIDGSINAVSGNAVFDALATKAPISSVHNPVTLGMANGLSLATQQLSLGLASSGVTGALSGTDWNTFNGKFNTPTGLTTNFLPKWNGSGFGNSSINEIGSSVVSLNKRFIQQSDVYGIPNGEIAYFGGSTNVSSAVNSGGFGVYNKNTGDWYTSELRFFTSPIDYTNPSNQPIERLRVTPSGRVLINKTDDDLVNQLQVNGNGKFTGTITANSYKADFNNSTANYVSEYDNLPNEVTKTKILYNSADQPPGGGVNHNIFTKWNNGFGTILSTATYGGGGQDLFIKSKYGGTWSNWNKIVKENTDGTISASPATTANQVVVKSQLDAAASSGSYTPTGNVITGATSVSAQSHTYIKIGNIVTVYGESKPTPVVAGVTVIYEISLPIARANTVTKTLGFGSINVAGGSTNQFVRLESLSATTVRISFNINAAGTPSVLYSFQYDITQ